jgi:hypothetical protein
MDGSKVSKKPSLEDRIKRLEAWIPALTKMAGMEESIEADPSEWQAECNDYLCRLLTKDGTSD